MSEVTDRRIQRKVYTAPRDEVNRLVAPYAEWILGGAELFTRQEPWDTLNKPLEKMTTAERNDYFRGRISIAGFRRPDGFRLFQKTTVMCALAKHTMMHDLWSKLGVRWTKSKDIDVDTPLLDLGSRRLDIYWLSDQGWSKYLRDKSGGIDGVLKLISEARTPHGHHIIPLREPILLQLNRDDAQPDGAGRTRQDRVDWRKHWPNATLLPFAVHGLDQFKSRHILVHVAALNPFGEDITWLEKTIGVSSKQQREARLGQQIYQTLCRLSIRNPQATSNITCVVADKSVAEFLSRCFHGQVRVLEIPSAGVIKRREKPGPKPKSPDGKPISAKERMRAYRARLKGKG